MALSMLRLGVQACRGAISNVRLVPAAVLVDKKRTIVSKQFKKNNPDKPLPWPYEARQFNLFETIFEDTQDRFDENSRMIVIEGNVGVGKSYLAKKLAEELDFLLFPEANLDMKFIDDCGFDIRSIEHLMPETVRPYDIAKFYANPHSVWAATFQYSMLALRYEQYLDAMAHLLNTGQGVILERSPYTDFVFMEAMFKAGYVNKYDLEIYHKMKRNCGFDIFQPHLVIYLDAPVNVLQDRIKKRGLPYEQNTSVLTPEYLGEIERNYKESYLPKIQEKVEVVHYDWSDFGDPHQVVEDIERLPLDAMMDDSFSRKFMDWKHHNPRAWDHYRMKVTNRKNELLVEAIYSVARLNHIEYLVPAEDILEYNAVYEKYYEYPYAKGFNKGESSYFSGVSNYRERQRVEFFRTR